MKTRTFLLSHEEANRRPHLTGSRIYPGSGGEEIDRRGFIRLAAGGAAGTMLSLTPGLFAATSGRFWEPHQPFRALGDPVRVQPIFMFALPTKKSQASWRSWGGIQTESDVHEEAARIDRELRSMAAKADFRLEILPVAKVSSADRAEALAGGD